MDRSEQFASYVVSDDLFSQFKDAVLAIHEDNLTEDDATLRKLFGLAQVAQYGKAPPTEPPPGDEAALAQWQAHTDCSHLTSTQAMEEYVSIVDQLTVDSLDDAGTSQPEPLFKKQSQQPLNNTTSPPASQDQPGGTAASLHEICRGGHENDLRVALAAGLPQATLNKCDEDGFTALMLAVDGESEACVRCLVEHGAALDIVDSDGQTVFHYAALIGNEAITQILTIGAETAQHDPCLQAILKMRCNDNNTAQELAAKQKNSAVAALLSTE